MADGILKAVVGSRKCLYSRLGLYNLLTYFRDGVCIRSSSAVFPARSLEFTIFGESFVYVTVF